MNLNQSIYAFNLSNRTYNITVRERIFSIKDLIDNRYQLPHFQWVGKIVFDEFLTIILDFILLHSEELSIKDILKRPIDMYNLTERTLWVLLKVWCFQCFDVIKNRDILYNKKWVWKKIYSEIENFIYSILSDIFCSLWDFDRIERNNSEWQDKMQLYYIPIEQGNFKIWKTTNILCREQWKIPLNEYLSSIRNVQDFHLEDFLETYLNTLTDIEYCIMKNIIWFIWNWEIRKYSDIARQYWVTWERIRQKERELRDRLQYLVENLKRMKILWELNCNNKNFIHLDFTDKKDNTINGKFLSYVYSNIYSQEYETINISQNRDVSEILILYKSHCFDKKVIYHLFDNIDKLYLEKRPEDISLSRDELIAKIIDNKTINILFWNQIFKEYEKILIEYLSVIYYIFEFNNHFVFSANKKDLKFLVNKELEQLDSPIHYKDMYTLVLERYPQYNRNVGKVHSSLRAVGKNVWDGLYIKQSSSMIEWSIVELAEIFLERQGIPMSYTDIENFILENKKVKKTSLTAMIYSDKEKRFVKTLDNKIALKKWNLSNVTISRNKNNICQNVYEYMKNHPLEEYTIENLMNLLWYNEYQNIYHAVYQLEKQWKIKYFTRWRVNYYYVL